MRSVQSWGLIMTHSFLAPSSADVWVHCAGNPLMSSIYPDADTIEAQEGEASHWVVSEVLKSYTAQLVIPSFLLDATCPENGIIINADMIECAEVMIDDVLSVCQEYGLLQHLHIEERMEIPSISSLNGGTPDAWAFDIKNMHLHLWDYKYGHKDVQADSWQNKNYIAGILDILKIDGYTDQQIDVTMKIVQPRSYNDQGPVKEYRCSASDLRGEFNLLRSQATLAETSEPGVISGNHCRYCRARHACPSARSAASSAVDYAMSAIPMELSDDGVSFELALLERGMKAIEHRHAAIKEDAINRIEKKGASIRGYGITSGVGNRKYNSTPPDEIAVIGESVGIEMYKPRELITPAAFDKQLAAVNKKRKAEGDEAIDKAVINDYLVRPSTGMKLVPSNETQAIKAFKRL